MQSYPWTKNISALMSEFTFVQNCKIKENELASLLYHVPVRELYKLVEK